VLSPQAFTFETDGEAPSDNRIQRQAFAVPARWSSAEGSNLISILEQRRDRRIERLSWSTGLIVGTKSKIEFDARRRDSRV